MATETKNPEGKIEDEHDPSQADYDRKFNDITHRYNDSDDTRQSLHDREFDQIRNGYDQTADDSKEQAAIERLRTREEAAKIQQNGPEKDGIGNREGSRFATFKNNRKALTRFGIGSSIIALLVSGFFALIPLKLEMLIKTATEHAAEIPEYAIQHRVEYLTRRYIIMKITGTLADSTDIDVGKAGLASSLFNTWKAAKYEEQLGLSIKSNRIKPGSTATAWEIRDKTTNRLITDGSNYNETDIDKKITSSKDMRIYIKDRVAEKTKWHQFYKRYAMRKTLMRTKGVTRWSWMPQSVTDKIDSYNAYKAEKLATVRDFRKKMYENTVKRVLPRTPLYLSCLTDYSACKDIIKARFSTTPEITCQPDDTVCLERQRLSNLADQQLQDSLDAQNSSVDNAIDEAVDKPPSPDVAKAFTKEMLAKILGGAAILDTIFRIVDSLDQGSLNQVVYDRNSTMAAGYSTEILTHNAQAKAGKLTTAQFATDMDMLGDFGISPAWQVEAGIIKSTVGKRFERDCSSNAAGEKTLLDPGETVCPERRIITNFLAFTQTNPFWKSLATLAEWWKNSVGRIFDLFNWLTSLLHIDDVIAKIMSATGLDQALAKVLDTIMNLVFGSPVDGSDTNAEAGDNVLGGIKSSYFAIGEAGQDTDQEGNYNGLGLGIGGAAISPQATAELRSKIAAEKKAEWKQKSVFARIFDTSDINSTASQLAIRVPTSIPQLATVPTILQESLFSLISPNTFAAAPAKDPFGFDFAYAYPDAQLSADPVKYNDDTCKVYAQEREDSYSGIDKTGLPILAYTKTDPCALEKVVIASAKAMFTSEPDPNFELGANPTNGTSVIPPSYAPGTWVWPADGPVKQGYGVPNPGRGGLLHKGIDIAEPGGTPVVAAHDGVVVGGGLSYDDPSVGRIVTIQVNGVSPALYMVYQHLSPTGKMPSGQVRAGQTVIGKVASYSEVSSYYLGSYTHLHFQLQTTNKFIVSYSYPNLSLTQDPLKYLPPR